MKIVKNIKDVNKIFKRKETVEDNSEKFNSFKAKKLNINTLQDAAKSSEKNKLESLSNSNSNSNSVNNLTINNSKRSPLDRSITFTEAHSNYNTNVNTNYNPNAFNSKFSQSSSDIKFFENSQTQANSFRLNIRNNPIVTNASSTIDKITSINNVKYFYQKI